MKLLKQFDAARNSKLFTPLLSGANFQVGNEVFKFQVEESVRLERPRGYRFAKYSFKSKVRTGEIVGYGFGEDDNELCAIQKSMSEAVERAAFYLARTLQPNFEFHSTNGWAAHVTEEKCKENALYELLERDAVLLHWLKQIPMSEVAPLSFPAWLKAWAEKELVRSSNFNSLRVLISSAGHIPTATIVLANPEGNAICSHAADKNPEVAISKALIEACRIAHWFDREAVTSIPRVGASKLLEEHAFYYSKNSKLPAWLFGPALPFATLRKNWNNHYKQFQNSDFKYEFCTFARGPIVVGYCRSEEIQDLYLGPTEIALHQGKINFARLGMNSTSGNINLGLHIVS